MNVKRLGRMWQVGCVGVTLALGVTGCEGASTKGSSGATVPAADGSDDATVDRDPGTPGGWNYVDAVDMGPVGSADATDGGAEGGDGSTDSADASDSSSGYDGYDGYDGYGYDGADATDGYDGYEATDGSADASDGGDWSSDGSGWSDATDGGSGVPSVAAGAYDDNANYTEFQTYLATHSGLYGSLAIDVSERYVLAVDGTGAAGRANQKVDLYADDTLVLSAVTNAAGRLLFHPRAYALPIEFGQFKAVVGGVATTFAQAVGGASVSLAVPETSANAAGMDVVLMIDTTGSMGDEIASLQATWADIVTSAAGFATDVRWAIVAYRDQGDQYEVKYIDFTSDTNVIQAALDGLVASGGGDAPEDFNLALHTAVEELSWRENAASRVLFTLADAEPHTYPNTTTYAETVRTAVERGIRIHTIAASGSSEAAEYVFRQVAQFTFGRFLFLTYDNDIPGKPGTGTGSGGDDGYSVSQYLSGTLGEIVEKLLVEEQNFISGIAPAWDPWSTLD